MSNFPQKITSVTKTFSSFIIVSLISILVASCASSSSSGGGSAETPDRGVSVFSHSGYTFIPVDRNITLGDVPATVGRVLIKDAEIKDRVTTEINRLIDAGDSEADKVEADDIANNDYTIKYSFVGADADDANYDANSVLNRYFSIDFNGIITVSSPYAFPVSLEDIFKDVPSVTVKVEVTITRSAEVEVEKPLSYTVRVNFPGVAAEEPNVNDAVSFDVTKVEEGGNEDKDPIRNQNYEGTISGTLPEDTQLNGSTTGSFTDLLAAAVKTFDTDTVNGAGSITDNKFKLTDLLNVTALPATDIGVVQELTLTFTPESGVADVFTHTDSATDQATRVLPLSLEVFNGDLSIEGSFWDAVATRGLLSPDSRYTTLDADDVLILNASIAWSFTYTYIRDFQPEGKKPGRVELNRTVQFGEEQPVTTAISIDGVNNALNRYGFTTKATEKRTIFFTLLESPIEPGSCANANIYLDNEDAQVKAGTSFNYENLNTEAARQHKCILGASFTGADADYQALVAKINATTIPAANVNSGTAPGGCDVDFNCYYASLTVNITDVDEAPTIVPASALLIAEGKGVDPKYLTRDDTGVVTGPAPLSGALSDLTSNDASTGNLADIGGIIIADTDKGADGNVFAVNATETKVISVSPAYGAGLFSIVETVGSVNGFTLRVNATKLDYEKFVEEDDLNAAGKAIYMVTISTQDLPEDSDDKKGFDKAIVKTMQVPVEITDVRYAPVPVATGFTKAMNIENRSDTLVLLPGASMLANGRSTLGAVKAVNPETDSDKGLFYAVMNSVTLADPENNFAVVSGLGDGTATPQNLILRGLGLAEGNDFTLTVVAFSIPADFNSQDSDGVQAALVTSITPIGVDIPNIGTGTNTGVSIPISITVGANVGEYASLTLLDPDTAPTFTGRQLSGNITENTAGDNVSVAPSTPLVLFNVDAPDTDFVNFPVDLAEGHITPHFALVTKNDFKTFGDTSALGINPDDSALFSISSSSGAISLKEGNEATFPVFYNLVVRLANASAGDAISLSHDYAVVTVLVNDENTAPTVTDFKNFPTAVGGSGIFTEIGNVLNITIDENTPTGTVLARFTVTDDNDNEFAEQDFTFGAIANVDSKFHADNFYGDAVKLTFAPVEGSASKQKISTATLTLVQSLSFEDFTSNLIDDNKVTLSETSTISDKGKYELNPLTGQVLPAPVDPAEDVESASLKFNLIVLDVAEKPLISAKAGATSGTVMENATINTVVSGITITITNVNATDAGALIYELGDEKFDEAFDVFVEGDLSDDPRVLKLRVADVDKLENLGDGQLHTSTLTITNNTGGTGSQDASDPITIQVRVIDVEQDITPISLSATTFAIAETDVDGGVADRTHVITESLFTYKATDVSLDADDFVTIGGKRSPLVSVDYSITGVSFGSSTPDVAENINSNSPPALSLKAPLANGSVSLVVGDTDYIEASLFGTISATLNVTGTAIGRTVPFMNGDSTFTVNVIQAADKVVSYDTTSDNAPAVYGFEYTQSEYADEIVEGEAVLATTVNSENGEDSQVLINVDGEKYNTTTVRVPGNAANTYFIERSVSEDIVAIGDNMHAVHTGTLVIPFTSDEEITDVTEMQILSEDASGKLEVATNFANYFNIEVNNSYSLASSGTVEGDDKVLLITQKRFDVYHSNGTLNADIKYNALDTIPLFKGATEETTRTYYIRTSQGDDDANTYALAQFYVFIEASGLNIPAKIEELYVHTVNVAYTDALATTASINFNVDPDTGDLAGSIGENDITETNFFDDYSLFINVSNNDYPENQVGGTTVITVSVPGGGLAPTDVTNPVDGSNKRVSDNQLIALRTAGGSAAPLATNTNNVEITQDAGVYETYNIDFALARNVYGTATINIKIQENDASGSEIDSNNYEFTLTVNEDAGVNNAPTITPQLTAGASVKDPEDGTLNFLLDEDLLLLAGASGDPSEKVITIAHGDVNANDATRRQEGVITSINVAHDDDNPDTNNRNKDIFTHTADATTMNYQEHGWGITDITYGITETEPRGFGAVTATYTTELPSIVAVTQVNDNATLEGNLVVPSYELTEFGAARDTGTDPEPAKPFTIIYNDNDLKFATFPITPDASVLPLKITEVRGTVTPAAPATLASILTIGGDGAPKPVDLEPTQFMVAFTTDFPALQPVEYDAIFSRASGAIYPVTFGGEGTVDEVANIRITVPVSDHEVVQSGSDAVFYTDGVTIPFDEGQPGKVEIASITVNDGDFARALVAEDVETLDFLIDSVVGVTGESNLIDKVEWSTKQFNGDADTIGERQKTSTITVAEVNDTDVGTYTVTWIIRDELRSADEKVSTGSFTLDVQNVLEPLTLGDAGVVAVNYPDDGEGTLQERSTGENKTIATISGITISGGDLNLIADEGLGVLVKITPLNPEGDQNGADKQLIELVDFDNTDSNVEFENTKPSVTYFISTADIDDGGVLPEFNLVADAEFAGDKLNVNVSAVLATGIADAAIVGTETLGDYKEFATNYDIQSPPSDLTIGGRTIFTGSSAALGIIEGQTGTIVITFMDKNIEGGSNRSLGRRRH